MHGSVSVGITFLKAMERRLEMVNRGVTSGIHFVNSLCTGQK